MSYYGSITGPKDLVTKEYVDGKIADFPIYTTTTGTTSGYYRIATIPIGTQFKQVGFKIKAFTAAGTTTESTIFVNLAYYAGNYTNQYSAILANTSHSYNSQTSAENGWVLRYCRVSFDATNGYIDIYDYKTTALTIQTQPIGKNDWVWATGALTVNPTVGAYRSATCTLDLGVYGNSLYAQSAGSSATAATATKLATARTLSLTGDVTGSNTFDGSGNTAIAATLANSSVSAGTYKSVTVNAKGLVTGGTNPTTLSGYGITDAQPKVTSLTVTLSTGGWSSLQQTVSASGVTASNIVLIGCDATEYYLKGVYCSGQGSNTLTFRCNAIPTISLSVKVVIFP